MDDEHSRPPRNDVDEETNNRIAKQGDDSGQSLARHTDLLDQISPYDFVSYEDSLLHEYHKIYDGFFNSPLYEQWLEGRHWRLRCHGPPRSGKVGFHISRKGTSYQRPPDNIRCSDSYGHTSTTGSHCCDDLLGHS